MINRETARPPSARGVLCRDVDSVRPLVTAMKKEGRRLIERAGQ